MIFITGIAGFVGSNLASALLRRGDTVAGFDNLRLGSLANLKSIIGNQNLTFEAVDLANLHAYRQALTKVHSRNPVTEIWHLAANSDIPAGIANPLVDLSDTLVTTVNTLILMKELKIGTIAFASSSAVYGDLGERNLDEDTGPLFPISNYGAMKLASEASISAAVESYLQQAFVFRFPNVVGVPATHGVILDFVRKLKITPATLEVLGNGMQQKCYLHVDELVEAMLYIRKNANKKLNYFNVGAADEGVTVRFIAEQVVAKVAPAASIKFGQGNKGWIGDVPKFSYSISKLSNLGWLPNLGSVGAIERAVDQIIKQEQEK